MEDECRCLGGKHSAVDHLARPGACVDCTFLFCCCSVLSYGVTEDGHEGEQEQQVLGIESWLDVNAALSSKETDGFTNVS